MTGIGIKLTKWRALIRVMFCNLLNDGHCLWLLYHLRLICYTWVRVEMLIPTVAVLRLIACSWTRVIEQVRDRCPHPTQSFSSYLEQSFVFSDTVESWDWREVGLGGSRSVNPGRPKVGLCRISSAIGALLLVFSESFSVFYPQLTWESA